jgi:PKD repeat protein
MLSALCSGDAVRYLFRCFVALICWLIALPLPATTVGGATGNASADARPIVWKNRDGGEPTGDNRHYVSLVIDRTHRYLGVHPSDADPRMGLSAAGIGFGNATAHAFAGSPNYSYAHTQQLKQFVLGETSSLAEVRQAFIDNILGTANDWDDSVALMPGIFDANGDVVLYELGDAELYEYDPDNSARLAQFPFKIYARNNTVHVQTDHTDDFGITHGRYTIPRNMLVEGAERGGNTIADLILISRAGEADFDGASVPSRVVTTATMIAHGVLAGEDPRVATMWTALGQPDYACFVPVWVDAGDTLSPRVATNDANESLSGASEKLFTMRVPGGYDDYINSLLAPMEANFVSAVEAARTHWLRAGFDVEQARRIHLEASETAWQTMNVMAAGTGFGLNVTPELTDLDVTPNGLSVDFSATASDPDGTIASYDWDFGDGATSTAPAPSHTYAGPGTFLVRVRVTDDGGSRNSRFAFVSLGAGPATAAVSVVATDAEAGEPGDPGVFTVTREGPTAGALTVAFSASGTAEEGVDYQALGATVVIPDGATSAPVTVTPLDDNAFESQESVVLTLEPLSGYAVAAPANASVSISDDEQSQLFGEGDDWRYFEGTSFPGAAWATLAFDDSTWEIGPTGIGYGDGDDATVLSGMQGAYITLYMRRAFSVTDPGTISSLVFDVDYDDGFVAYLNGTEVARRGVPLGQVVTTTAANHEAGSPESIDLAAVISELRAGSNVFAIEVHNQDIDSSDLSIVPTLRATGGAEPPPVTACSNGLDDDGDGLADFPGDPGCASTSDTSERSFALACDDGVDNDGDGLTDFPADPECGDPSDPSEEPQPPAACENGLDDDGDGLIDYPADPDCDAPDDPSEGFGTVLLSADFELNGQGTNVDSIAFWEAPDPADTLMLVTSKGSQLVEVWQHPFTGNELAPLSHPSFGNQGSVQVNGVAVDQGTDRLYVAVSDPTSTVGVFSLPDLSFQFEFIDGAVDLQAEPNLALLQHPSGQTRAYVSADDIVYVHDATTGASIGSFVPDVGLETLAADDLRQALFVPDENGGTGIYAYDPDGNPFQQGGTHQFGAGVFDADAEGIAIYSCPSDGSTDDGTGWLVVADQRPDVTEFEFFDRVTWGHLGTVQLLGVSNTDGIGSTQKALPGYPQGVFAAIDDDTSVAVIGWDRVLNAAGLSCGGSPPATACDNGLDDDGDGRQRRRRRRRRAGRLRQRPGLRLRRRRLRALVGPGLRRRHRQRRRRPDRLPGRPRLQRPQRPERGSAARKHVHALRDGDRLRQGDAASGRRHLRVWQRRHAEGPSAATLRDVGRRPGRVGLHDHDHDGCGQERDRNVRVTSCCSALGRRRGDLPLSQVPRRPSCSHHPRQRSARAV